MIHFFWPYISEHGGECGTSDSLMIRGPPSRVICEFNPYSSGFHAGFIVTNQSGRETALSSRLSGSNLGASRAAPERFTGRQDLADESCR